MDLLKITRSLKPVKGQRLADWLQRFLVIPTESLSKWHGSFTEVTTAKVVEIFRKRGVIEEHEVNQARFGCLVNACYRAQVFMPPIQAASVSGDETPQTEPSRRRDRW